MSRHTKRENLDRLLAEIRKVLHDWSPLGRDVPQDEYEFMEAGVYRELERGASIEDLMRFFSKVRDDLALKSGRHAVAKDKKTALQLKQLWETNSSETHGD